MSQATGDNPKAGTQNASGTPAGLPNQNCSAVIVQNDPGSSVNLLVGDANLQPLGLKAGQAISIPCSNTDQVFIATGSSTATCNFISVN